MNTLNYSGGCDWAWGCDREGALRGRRPETGQDPPPLPREAPSSLPSLATVFRLGAGVNDHMGAAAAAAGGLMTLSLRPAAREAG